MAFAHLVIIGGEAVLFDPASRVVGGMAVAAGASITDLGCWNLFSIIAGSIGLGHQQSTQHGLFLDSYPGLGDAGGRVGVFAGRS